MVEFVDELPDIGASRGHGAHGRWLQLLRPLMNQPNQWAILEVRKNANSAASAAANLNKRRVRIPDGEWEFASRKVDDEYRVYGRYLGPSQ